MKKVVLFLIIGLNLKCNFTKAQIIALGEYHSLSICTDSTVKAWGDNYYGQLGNGTIIESTVPASVSGMIGITSIGAGSNHSLFVKNDGTVWACGQNFNGQLGDGTTLKKTIPVQVSGLSGIIAVAGGWYHSLFLKNDGTVWACGYSAYGQLGDGNASSMDRITPVQVSGLSNVIAISSKYNHSLFLKNDGTVWACGDNSGGQLGDGTNTNRNVPVQVVGLSGVIAIEAGTNHSLFLKNDGTVWACGRNTYGQLGDETTVNRNTPIQVPRLVDVISISGGFGNSFFLKNAGIVMGVGYNVNGQLGIGSTTNSTTLVQVGELSGISTIAAGINHSFFLKNTGTLWNCGRNNHGQLGDGSTTQRINPVQTINLCQVQQSNYLLKGVYGEVYNDINQNCIKENESLLIGRKLIITPGNLIVETLGNGYWYIDSLPPDTYTIIADTSGNWTRSCSLTQSFTITNPDSFYYAPSFGFLSTNPCAEPNISVVMPFMRTSFGNQNIYINACNEVIGTGALNNAYVILELDPLLIPQSATLSYTSLGNNQYRFDLGDINPSECNIFSVACSLSIDAILGQTLCMEAELFPQPGCVFDSVTPAPTPPDFTPCTLPWDKSIISVDGWCQNDSIYFTITNTGDPGDGDMDCFSPVRLYIDGQYIVLDSVQLLGGQIDTLVYAGDGRTWRLEVDQHPLHPGHSSPNATIELCGDANNWTSDLVNILPMDDEDPIVDIYCGIVTGSYDPNDKTGYPLGITGTHFVAPNGKMEYVIRFQNTGTDTAFTVVIRDTLDTDLNIFSVHSGASSHNYSFRMYGPRVLEWTFNNILLPDSNVNVEGSNGFVTFSVNQAAHLADFTEIRNSAAIYFDFNAPVITNTTSHVVKRAVQQSTWLVTNEINDTICNGEIYLGNYYSNSGSYFLTNSDTLTTLNLIVDNTIPQAEFSYQLTGFEVSLNDSSSNDVNRWYWSIGGDSLSNATQTQYEFTQNGAYDICLIASNDCFSDTLCRQITIMGVGIAHQLENGNIKVYPNPATDQLLFDVNGVHITSIKIVDLSGRVRDYKVSFPTGQQQVDVSTFPQGLYLYQLLNDNEIIGIGEFIKK